MKDEVYRDLVSHAIPNANATEAMIKNSLPTEFPRIRVPLEFR